MTPEDKPNISDSYTADSPAMGNRAASRAESPAFPVINSNDRRLPPLLSRENTNKNSTEPSSSISRDEEQDNHQPPMSVIVVSTSSSSSAEARQAERLSSTPSWESHSPPSMFSTPFRLQPRNAAMAVSAAGRDGAVRGRKRPANSMSMSASAALARDSLLTTATKAAPANVSSTPELVPSIAVARPEEGLPQTTISSVAMATPKRQGHNTPPRGPGSADHSFLNFQCLSLQSPKRKNPPISPSYINEKPSNTSPPQYPNTSVFAHSGTPGRPPSSSSSSYGTAPQQRPAMMVPGSISTTVQPRSSFTPVYNAASPGGSLRSIGSGSIGSNHARMNVSARAAASTSAGSTKSSPKIAPLTVLKDRGTKLPAREGSASHQRPPLPGGSMNSLWLSLESSGEDHSTSSNSEDEKMHQEPTRMCPPRTVHCRRPSWDSISTVHNSVLSSPMMSPRVFSSPASAAPPPAGICRPSPMMSPRIFSSPASAAPPGMPKASCTPRSKQRRLDEMSSPSQGTPRTPRTPLPRVTLTPRSTSSRHSRNPGHQGLPMFPSPDEPDMDVTSTFLTSAAATSLRGTSLNRYPERRSDSQNIEAIRSLFPASSNSLALSADGSVNDGGKVASCASSLSASTPTIKREPLPVLDHSKKELGAASPDKKPSPLGFGDFSGGSFMGVQTKSLLTPSRSGGILQAMMEETPGRNGDMGSVSDIDEDEGFILASPRAIEQERFASCQPARQRRRRSCDRSSQGSPNTSASNTNLAGMNYVTSSTSLFGMDIAHPADVAGGPPPEVNRQTTLASPTSPKDLFCSLAEDDPSKYQTTGGQGHLTLKRRKSDASYGSIGLTLEGHGGDGGRDLVTPPPMPTPQTPPPISPRGQNFLPVVMPQGSVYHHAGSQSTSVCLAGADRQSVTMAIARMAHEAQHHTGSSPVS